MKNNPHIPGIPPAEQSLLYAKLNEYNRNKASFKEVGIYFVVLPRPNHPNYSLWFYSPLVERQCILYIDELSNDIYQSLRSASTMLYYSRRSIIIAEYNAKRMCTNSDDLIGFGKYQGHFIHEIFRIDPSYLSWIVYQFKAQRPKQERFLQLVKAYNSVHQDLLLRINKATKHQSEYIGQPKEKLTNLILKIIRIKIEDNPYKTRVIDQRELFYIKQVLTLIDQSGNLVVIHWHAKHPSASSCTIPSLEHAYSIGEVLFVNVAHVLRTYISNGMKYTRLTHVKLNTFKEGK